MLQYLKSVPPERADNPGILAWWDASYDELMLELMRELSWHYCLDAPRVIKANATSDGFEEWCLNDPLSRQNSWEGVLLEFIVARCSKLGLDATIPPPQLKVCAICEGQFPEDAIPKWAYTRVGGRDALDFCEPCSRKAFQPNNSGGQALWFTQQAVIERYASGLARVAQMVPPQNFFEPPRCLAHFDRLTRIELMKIAQQRPTREAITRTHGTWFNVLRAAGVVENGLQSSRGVKCVAVDGHLCLSLAEKTIDDWLHLNGIEHDREPPYPATRMRGDFLVNGKFVEYFGLVGNADYDQKIKKKRELAARYSIPLVEIYPQDLATWHRTQRVVARRLEIDLRPE